MPGQLASDPKPSERGNVLFLILIAVALFAALSYAVTSSTRTGSSDVSEDKAKLAASEIMQDFQRIAQAIDRVRITNRCSVEEIQFTSPLMVMSNSNSPADRRCHIFYAEGGGVVRVKLNPDYFDASKFVSGTSWHTNFGTALNYLITFNPRNRQANMGTNINDVTSVDLLANLYGVTDNICRSYNKLNGYNAPTYSPTTHALWVEGYYGGVFTNSNYYSLTVPTACVYNTTYGANLITFALVER